MAGSQQLARSQEEPLQLPGNAFRVSEGSCVCAEEVRVQLPFRLESASFRALKKIIGGGERERLFQQSVGMVLASDLVFCCSAAEKL